ncbi:MAG TPA: Gfo/Idh/MocA family oxidoreductase [bacterium]|nr:Gfo/Idh/MocA family oxidoreductase [bacterium]
MDRIRTAVVGLNHGLTHAIEILANPRFQLVAICDHDQTKLAWMRGEAPVFDNEPGWYRAQRTAWLERARAYPELAKATLATDFDALLAMPEVDAVVLAVPIRLNAPLAIRTLRAGKHCFASKPFAINAEQGGQLLQAVRDSRHAFIHGFQYRYSPLFTQVRRMIDAGFLGTVKQLWWNMTRLPLRASHNRLELSGGPYLAECCHWLDLFEFFQPGARFTRVAAFGGLDVPDTHVDFPDNAVTIIDYTTGVRGSLNFTYFTNQPEYNVWGIQGTHGKIRGDTEQAGRFIMFSGPTQDRTEYTVNVAKAYHGLHGHLGFDCIHDAFADQIRSRDHAAAVDEAERGFENLLLCLAADRAILEGRIVHREEFATAGARA